MILIGSAVTCRMLAGKFTYMGPTGVGGYARIKNITSEDQFIVPEDSIELIVVDAVNNTPELRCYCFMHFQLGSIHKGIQAAHIVSELSITDPNDVYQTWATRYKTLIVLNGGNSAMLRDKILQLNAMRADEHYPIATFSEDEETLEGVLTGFGMILPDYLYAAKPVYRHDTVFDKTIMYYEWINPITHEPKQYSQTSLEGVIISILQSCQLAI